MKIETIKALHIKALNTLNESRWKFNFPNEYANLNNYLILMEQKSYNFRQTLWWSWEKKKLLEFPVHLIKLSWIEAHKLCRGASVLADYISSFSFWSINPLLPPSHIYLKKRKKIMLSALSIIFAFIINVFYAQGYLNIFFLDYSFRMFLIEKYV